MFGSALLRCEGFRFGIGCLGVIQMTWDGHRQVRTGQIGVGMVTVVTLREHVPETLRELAVVSSSPTERQR